MKHNWRAYSKRLELCVLLCAVGSVMAGCAAKTVPQPSATPERLHAYVTPAPTLTNDPAPVYKRVLTDQRVISLVLEGYTDEQTMATVLSDLSAQKLPAVYFVSGITANEHPDTVSAIAEDGFEVGNYGLNASKDMQDNDVTTNVHQLQRGQELISQVIGRSPTLFRCNGSVYTRELLQAGASVGLKAAVLPNVFLNHTSFANYEAALTYVQKLARGSILSIKLGQSLDSDEFGGQVAYTTDRAIDPQPFLSDNMDDTIAETYANVVNVAVWLFQALDAEGYTVLSPQALEATRITMFDDPTLLDTTTLALVNIDNYTLPRTEKALPNPVAWSTITLSPTATPDPEATADPETTVEPEATGAVIQSVLTLPAGTVFVGDSITQGMQGYVDWKRETEPTYLGDAQFFTSTDFSIGMALGRVTDSSVHPKLNGTKMTVHEAVKRMGARLVLLMPGQYDVRAYSTDQMIENLKLMIYEIRQAVPTVQVVVQSIFPGVAARTTAPTNELIFEYNLALYQFCVEFQIPFVDTAYLLGNDQGNLPDTLCLDPNASGILLNDAGCALWLKGLQSQLPK